MPNLLIAEAATLPSLESILKGCAFVLEHQA